MEPFNRIKIDPRICLGRPVIRDTRITVSTILKMMSNGHSTEDVLTAYPELETDDIYQAMRYAAWVVSDQTHSLPTAV